MHHDAGIDPACDPVRRLLAWASSRLTGPWAHREYLMRPDATRRFGFAGTALLCLLLAGCGGSPRMSAVPTAGDLPDQEVSDFEAQETDQGALQWKMYARSAATYRARNTVIA